MLKIAVPIVVIIVALLCLNGLVLQPKRIRDNFNAQAKACLESGDLYGAREDFTSANNTDQLEKLDAYEAALAQLKRGNYLEAYAAFTEMGEYHDAAKQAENCHEYAYEQAQKDLDAGKTARAYDGFLAVGDYGDAVTCAKSIEDAYAAAEKDLTDGNYETAKAEFEALTDYPGAADKVKECANHLTYNDGMTALQAGDYPAALTAFEKANALPEAAEAYAALTDYTNAQNLYAQGDYTGARNGFAALGDYLDSTAKVEACYAEEYAAAEALLNANSVAAAYEAFNAIGEYSDSAQRAAEIANAYEEACAAMENKDWATAAEAFSPLYDYADSVEKAKEACYNYAESLVADGDKKSAEVYYTKAVDYSDASEKLPALRAELAKEAQDYAEALRLDLLLEQSEEVKAQEYALAQKCMDAEAYGVAVQAYESLGQYELSTSKLPLARAAYAELLFEGNEYRAAQEQFLLLEDGAERAKESVYRLGLSQLEAGEWDTAKETFKEVKDYSDAAEQMKECDYRKATKTMSEGDYAAAKEQFVALNGYSDSAEQVKECTYQIANAYLKNGNYAEVLPLYEDLGNYSESTTQANTCRSTMGNTAFENGDYAQAHDLFEAAGDADMESKSRYAEANELFESGNYADAVTLYESLEGYENSADNALKCHNALGDAAKESGDTQCAIAEYVAALPLGEAKASLLTLGKAYASDGEYEKAIMTLSHISEEEAAQAFLSELGEVLKDSGKTEDALVTYLVLNDDETVKIFIDDTSGEGLVQWLKEYGEGNWDFGDEMLYRYAGMLLDAKRYEEAYKIYKLLRGYSDVDTLLTTEEHMVALTEEAKAPYRQRGNIVTYGHYEQDNDTSNGTEAIEWIVLSYDAETDCSLLISKYGLDAQCYDNGDSYLTWEKSDIRARLNDDFLNTAFTQEEQEGIQTVTISTPDYQGNSGGADTRDKLWLLSRDEAAAWLTSYEDRTAYAVANGAGQYDGAVCCWWWLRSPGNSNNSTRASIVNFDGSLDYYGDVDYVGGVVRPVFWLNLASANLD